MANNLKYTILAIDKFSSVFKKAGKSADNLARRQARINKKLQTGSALFTKLRNTAIGFYGGKKVLDTIVNFDRSMSKVKALTNATIPEFKALREEALRLGESTKFSASQVANAQAIMAQKGKSVNEIIKAMPGLLNLASAGNIQLGESADIVVGTMNAFNVEFSKTGEIVDQMAFITNKTGANMSNLGRGFVNLGADAASFKFTIAETSVLLGVLADKNILNERAGTGTKIMFQRLVKPTKEVQMGLEALGLTTKDVTPALHNAETILKTLKTAFDKQKDPMRKAKIEMLIYGSEATKVGKTLVGSTKEVERLNREILNQTGLAQKLSEVYEDNLGGDLLKLKSAMEGATLSTGDGGLTGALRSVTQASTMFFRNLGKKEKVDDLTDSMKGLLWVVEGLGWALQKSSEGWKTIFGGLERYNQASKLVQEDPSIKKEAGVIFNKSRAAGIPQSMNQSIIEAQQNRLLEESRMRATTQQATQQAELKAFFNFGNVPQGSNLQMSTAGNMDIDLGTNMSFGGY